MSVTINTGKLKIKGNDGNYIAMDAIANTSIEAIQDAASLGINSIENAASQVTSQLASAGELRDMIAEVFDETKSYKAGDYVIHTDTTDSINKLYRFTADHAAGTWTGTDATKAVVGEDIGELKNAFTLDTEQITGCVPLVFSEGRYVSPSSSPAVGDLIELKPVASEPIVSTICACQPGDIFTGHIIGFSGNNRAYFFCDSEMKLVANGWAGIYYELNGSVTAPADAAFAIFCNRLSELSSGYYIYKGTAIDDRVAAIEQMLPGAPFVYLGALTSTDDLNTLNVKGWYMWTTTNSPINAPYAGSVGKLLVFANGLMSIVQIFIALNSGNSMRYRIGNSYGFSEWKIVATKDELEAAIQTARDDLLGVTSKFPGKRMSIIGDSVSAFNPPGYRKYYPYGDVLDVRQMWWHRVITSSGSILDTTKASSGSYVTDYLADGETRELYPTFYERCSGLGAPDMIFVELGANDSQQNVPLGEYDYETDYTELSESYFRTAYIKGISALKANYPSADIYCFIIGISTDKIGYVESIRAIAKHFGIYCFDTTFIDYTRVQGPHPDDHGMRQIASTIIGGSDDDFTKADYPIKSQLAKEKFDSIESYLGIDMIEFMDHIYYETMNSGETLNNIINPGYTSNFKGAKVECQAGDIITIVGAAGTGHSRLYAFYDQNNVSLGRSGANLTGEHVVVAPANAAYIVINLRRTMEGFAYIRKRDSIDTLKNYGAGENPLTSDFSFYIYKDGNNANQVQVLRIASKYTAGDSSYPTIQYRMEDGFENALYTSPVYKIGSTVETKRQEWRLPSFYKQYDRYKVIITVPTGVSVTVDSIETSIESTHPYTGGIEFEAHHGFTGIYPGDTAIAFTEAGKLGFGYCTITPKFTSDEIPVCFHDDASIKGALRYNDGTVIQTGSLDDKPMWQFTYADILERFDAGIKKNAVFAGTKVPTLDDFFEICSKTGMCACMSIHSETGFNASSSVGCITTTAEAVTRWQKIYALAKKWGLLGRIYIKTGNSNIQLLARQTFGFDGNYILLQGISSTWDPLNSAKSAGFVESTATSMSECKYNVYFEWFETAENFDAKLATAKSEGFETLQIAEVNKLSGEQMHEFIEKGITRFTIDYHCSVGLNW